MITSTDVTLYRWYGMGITDPKDLQWLVEFYLHQSYSVSHIQFGLQEARRYYNGRSE